jgi:cation transport ATPase
MRGASDLARDVADITLTRAELDQLVTLRRLSQALMNRIHSNYRFIATFNSSVLLLGLTGLLTPATSAWVHNLSTIGVSAAATRPCLPPGE